MGMLVSNQGKENKKGGVFISIMNEGIKGEMLKGKREREGEREERERREREREREIKEKTALNSKMEYYTQRRSTRLCGRK